MSILDRISKSKVERLLPRFQNDIDKLIVLAREGNKPQRMLGYLQLANVVVDLLPEASIFKESYHNTIIECAVAGIADSDVDIQVVARLAAAQQLVQIVPVNSTFHIQLNNVIKLMRDKIDSSLYKRPVNLNNEQTDRISSLIAKISHNI
jgi:hypothetical protein